MRMDDIRDLIKILEESDLAEIEVARWWGWGRVRVSKTSPNAIAVIPQGHENGSGGGAKAAPAAGPAGAGTTAPGPAGSGPAMTQPETPAESRYVSIRSPMVGTFFRAPAPDAEPYIEVGQHVDVGQTVCIIEAMKLMNEIESDVRGRVVAVKTENKHPVEYGQVLFLVDPS